ncbi:BNR/Asp-box repeat domain protein [Desmospora sp. 8437]|uniref:BNR/Asp-box repeat-containing protein n=1 Tax=Kroppenstedtia guangzhouensis TaxID=1274356 RepID=A0ABQ1H4F2_9BACL|nr:BNR/Asp-box repeat domain protein [Desmospora sp. 8437]GGA57387.1 hypothetical protein GCM10007416_33270 [Kroppenstedtia guangzhouensis]
MIVVSVLLLSACGQDSSFSEKHIHGFAYSANGNQLLIATHDGLYSYRKGQWTGPIGEANDLMGFSLAQKGIFSSGHPPEGSSRPNPWGLIKSTDEGKTWKTIDFEGQSDFYQMTAGLQTGALGTPVPRLKGTGVLAKKVVSVPACHNADGGYRFKFFQFC